MPDAGKSGGKKKRGGELVPGVGGVLVVPGVRGVLVVWFRVEDITGTGVSSGVGTAGVSGIDW